MKFRVCLYLLRMSIQIIPWGNLIRLGSLHELADGLLLQIFFSPLSFFHLSLVLQILNSFESA